MKVFGVLAACAGFACVIAAAFMLHLIVGLFVLGGVLLMFGFAAVEVAKDDARSRAHATCALGAAAAQQGEDGG